MPKMKLTQRGVDAIQPPASGRLEIWDTTLPGFGLRVSDRGRKTWVAMYRVGGKLRRYTLGTYPGMKLTEAREEARRAMGAATEGEDVAAAKIAARRAEPDDKIPDTFGRVLDLYEKREGKARKSWPETRRILEKECAAWLEREVSEITRRDVRDLLDAVVDRGSPVMANRLRAYLGTVFSWAADREIIALSPVVGVAKPAQEKSRDRVLTESEIREVWQAAGRQGYPFGSITRLCLLTAQRRGEVASARWSDVDLKTRTWTIPREFTKTDTGHTVPLSDMTIAELKALPRFRHSPLVFPSRSKRQATGNDVTDAGLTPVSGWSRSKGNLDGFIHEARRKAAGGADVETMPHWTIHDLRRTAASGMARLGIAPHVIEKILNHSSGTISGVASIYNRHGYREEMQAALASWAAEVRRIVGD